ncbi:MAG: SIMPL domain-containing protein [Candidatus Hydrogenedentes bacterium]|nr:SIMPL domain-containing protein [Candidatus Hydrogenedentota bacterium]
MTIVRRALPPLVALIACAVTYAQAAPQPAMPPTTIESTGKATLDMTPDFADFTFVHDFSADTAEAALKLASPLAASLEEELKKRELAYRDCTAIGPVLLSQDPPAAQSSVVVRFALGTFQTSATGQEEFGALSDKLKQLGKDLGCAVSKPVFAVADVKSAESTALGSAVENAYAWGEGVARVLAAVITSVENVRVVEVKWGDTADLKRISCTATVNVKYTAVAGQS